MSAFRSFNCCCVPLSRSSRSSEEHLWDWEAAGLPGKLRPEVQADFPRRCRGSVAGMGQGKTSRQVYMSGGRRALRNSWLWSEIRSCINRSRWRSSRGISATIYLKQNVQKTVEKTNYLLSELVALSSVLGPLCGHSRTKETPDHSPQGTSLPHGSGPYPWISPFGGDPMDWLYSWTITVLKNWPLLIFQAAVRLAVEQAIFPCPDSWTGYWQPQPSCRSFKECCKTTFLNRALAGLVLPSLSIWTPLGKTGSGR